MMYRAVKVVLAAMVLVSCGHAFSDSTEKPFKDGFWNEPVSFDFVLEEGGRFEVEVEVSHVYGVKLPNVEALIELKRDGMETIGLPLTLVFMEDEESYVASCSGDYCDLEQEVEGVVKLDAGKYSITIAPKDPEAKIPGIFSMGLELEKAE